MQYFVIAVGALLFSRALVGQPSERLKAIPEADARQHLTQKVDPIYPPIAAAAHVEGEVVISAVIDERGRVGSEKVLSGPPMLQQAALDAVKRWQFNSFNVNGAPSPVTATITIPFHLEHRGPHPTAEQEKAAQALFPLADKCRSSLRAQNRDDALNFCKQALDMSARKCLTDKDEEYATPFVWRAIVKANPGQGEAALADFQTAEETYRRAIANLPDMKKIYDQNLAVTLKTHAALLASLGRPADAEKLRIEAAAL